MVERKRKALPSRQAVINPQNESVVQKTLDRALPSAPSEQPVAQKPSETSPPQHRVDAEKEAPKKKSQQPEPETPKSAPIRVYIPAGSKLHAELGEIEAHFAARKIKITPTNILASALDEHEDTLIKTLKRLYRS